MATGDFPPAAPCCCNQHQHFQPIAPGPVVGSVTFSADDGKHFYDILEANGLRGVGGSSHAHPGMAEHVRRAVDDYVATLGEVEDDAATVVELIQRGESWHISIRRGAMHYENAEPSLPAALGAVGRVLGEIVGSCAEVPTDFLSDAAVHAQGWAQINGMRDAIDRKLMADLFAPQRAELLASLPPVQITDPEALSKLTPARVRAYLKGKGWDALSVDGILEEWGWSYKRCELMAELSQRESRSAAAVYLDILQTEPGD